MSFSQLLSILKARRYVALGIFLFTVLVTVVVSLILPKQYTAEATVVVDVKSPDPIAGMVLPAELTFEPARRNRMRATYAKVVVGHAHAHRHQHHLAGRRPSRLLGFGSQCAHGVRWPDLLHRE